MRRSRDVLLRGATVVDGTGADRRLADVVVRGEHIAAVGPTVAAPAGAEVVDLSGLVLAPGFIDPHTHYDAQVLWDPDLTPSSWHGVTSVVMGNCGYGVAPALPDRRDHLLRTLEAVEGMAKEALEAGIEWTFETFQEYLGGIGRRGTRLNVGAMLGHSALRYHVLGAEAADRAATEAEVASMRQLLADAMGAGALGFSTSRATVDNGAGGKPVPSRMADDHELATLLGALGGLGRGTVQVVTDADGIDGTAVALAQLSRWARRPVTHTGVLTGRFGPRGAVTELLDRCHDLAGPTLVGQIACQPIAQQVTLVDPFLLVHFSDAFREIQAIPRAERRAAYADPGWRERALDPARHGRFAHRLPGTTVDESVAHPSLVGRRLDDIAAERRCHPMDVLVELSLDEDLGTRFRVVVVNDDEEEVGTLLNDRRTLLGLSDAGAHLSQICDAGYATHLLGHWVRERGALPLELAVWHLTRRPAEVFGITDRGTIAPGMAADLVAFDPATVGDGPRQRLHDLPAGADRLVTRPSGIEQVWVNGTAIVRDGAVLDGARPGAILHPNGRTTRPRRDS